MDQVPAKMKQRHRSAAEWRELISAWKQSGETREMWCHENGVGMESLRRWTKRLRRADSAVPFVQIEKSISVSAKSVPIQLRILASGDVELQGEFSEELLRRVLRVAREAADVS
jgi:hypothetical protein